MPHLLRSRRAGTPLMRVALAAAVLLPASSLFAQNAASWSPKEVLALETYAKPPAAIERLVTAPR
ncbi:MAG: hypothetical protein ABI120_09395, partial [Gemmatimonadaceae bacterium]